MMVRHWKTLSIEVVILEVLKARLDRALHNLGREVGDDV